MKKEYPPFLKGSAENQIAQLREYLVRLIGYIEQALDELPLSATGSDEDWQARVDADIGKLRRLYRESPLVQHGQVSETSLVVFAKKFSTPPNVFTTGGTVSDVSTDGFTLTTTGETEWLAVGERS